MFYENERGNVGVLEREKSTSKLQYSTSYESTENMQEARARTQRNLERLLNYDRYKEMQKQPQEPVNYFVQNNYEVNNDATQEVVDEASQEDINPTSTTMQFGDEDVNTMMNEMKNDEEEEVSYKLNKKGKLVVALYSICVAVVLALIILNTGIIAVLTTRQEAKAVELEQAMNEYNLAQENYAYATSEENVCKLAEEIGMIKE